MGSNYRKLGGYIRQIDLRNSDASLGEDNLYGISVTKEFIISHANLVGVTFNSYKVVAPLQFAYIPDTSRRGDKIAISLNTFGVDIIVSSICSVFEIIDENQLLPEYLMLWFMRPEFDRYARFMSNGSAREVFDWDCMCGVELPVPPIAEQRKIVHDYQVIMDRIELLQKMNENLEEIAKTVFKSYFETFEVFGGVCPDSVSVKTIDSLPIDVTDFVANGSFASLRENVTLYDEEEYAYYVRNTDLKVNDFTKYVDELSYKYLSKSTLFGGEVIISNVADVGSVFMCPVLEKPMTLGSNIIMLRSDNNIWSYYMYLYFKYFKGKIQIAEITTGSAQLKFNKTSFRELMVLVPNNDVLYSFNDAVKPFFILEDKYMCDIRYLKQLSHKYLASISFRGA